jgi:hypothetical protein
MATIKGKGSAEVREIAAKLIEDNKVLTKKNEQLEARNAELKTLTSKVQTKVKIKTKTENLPAYRKVRIGKVYAKKYIDEKIKGTFNTKISDLSMLNLITADFCSEHKLPLRQLGILLYASNFREVRKKDLHEGRNVGNWYAQTIEAMFEKGLLYRTNEEMVKWVYFTITGQGERYVKLYNGMVKEFLNG